MEYKHQNVQVITNELTFNKDGFNDFVKDHGLTELGSSYKCVAVIGCQSSGKSTLLNLVFGTAFEMMDDSGGRQQTTQGIWMSHSADKNSLILDIEGTDSKERGDSRLTFE
jgi:predicted GTPase